MLLLYSMYISLCVLRVTTPHRAMVANGRSILCVIHQPSSEVYHRFDRVLLMAEGRNVFMGDVGEAKQFFTE